MKFTMRRPAAAAKVTVLILHVVLLAVSLANPSRQKISAAMAHIAALYDAELRQIRPSTILDVYNVRLRW